MQNKVPTDSVFYEALFPGSWMANFMLYPHMAEG